MHTNKKTKIVATIGPASDSEEQIRDLILSGVNVFRFNTKHADVAWHVDRIKRVKKVVDELEIPVAILVDLLGPEIRIKTYQNQKVSVTKGEIVKFCGSFSANQDDGEELEIVIPRKPVFEALEVGDMFSIDDGFIDFKVTKKIGTSVFYAESMDDYTIGTNKGLNIPGKDINLNSLTKDDLLKLDAFKKLPIDFVALSFCRTKKDILTLRKALLKRKMDVAIVAKLESKKALDNLDEILDYADAIMVARGDLGVEVPIEQLAFWQKSIISRCRAKRIPVITATQMLDSMTFNPRPTRAEATDVANAVYDGTDAVMLSGETTTGKYPIKTVHEMAAIVRFNEKKRTVAHVSPAVPSTTETIIEAGMRIMDEKLPPNIDAVVVFTETGSSAKALSAYRTNVRIIAVSDRKETFQRLCLSYGIMSVFMDFPNGTFDRTSEVPFKILLEQGVLQKGETVLIIHGTHWKKAGLTNGMYIRTL